MNCQVDGCKEDAHWIRIEKLEKPDIAYSFSLKTRLCALHSTHLENLDEPHTYHSDKYVQDILLTV